MVEGLRLHLRFPEDLLPGQDLAARRQLYNVPSGAERISDIINDIRASRRISRDFVLAVCGSRVFPNDGIAILRDNDIVELRRVRLAKPAERGRILCSCCACSDPTQFSTWQWKRLCAGRGARCLACVAGSLAPVGHKSSEPCPAQPPPTRVKTPSTEKQKTRIDEKTEVSGGEERKETHFALTSDRDTSDESTKLGLTTDSEAGSEHFSEDEEWQSQGCKTSSSSSIRQQTVTASAVAAPLPTYDPREDFKAWWDRVHATHVAGGRR